MDNCPGNIELVCSMCNQRCMLRYDGFCNDCRDKKLAVRKIASEVCLRNVAEHWNKNIQWTEIKNNAWSDMMLECYSQNFRLRLFMSSYLTACACVYAAKDYKAANWGFDSDIKPSYSCSQNSNENNEEFVIRAKSAIRAFLDSGLKLL